jgi:hypothetical protein
LNQKKSAHPLINHKKNAENHYPRRKQRKKEKNPIITDLHSPCRCHSQGRETDAERKGQGQWQTQGMEGKTWLDCDRVQTITSTQSGVSTLLKSTQAALNIEIFDDIAADLTLPS